jgi:hypothetical protein
LEGKEIEEVEEAKEIRRGVAGEGITVQNEG